MTTGAELVALARGAGFDATQSRVMAAIALAESGGNPAAVGDQSLANATWGPSIGLWQVRSLNAHRGTGKERDATRLTDPSFNARSARIIYGQQGYRAWTVYSSGAYVKHLDATASPSSSSGGGFDLPGFDVERVPGTVLPVLVPTLPKDVPGIGGAALDAASGALTGLEAVGAFFGQLGQQRTWVRVLQVVGGAGMVVGGLALLGKDVAGAAVKVAADVIPAGRAMKAAGSVAKVAKVAKVAT